MFYRWENLDILRWAIEGCVTWQREGLGVPQAVKAATEDYRQEMDVLGRFIEENMGNLLGTGVVKTYDTNLPLTEAM